jgi:hypothetical protein
MARETLGPPELWAPVVGVIDAVSDTFGVPKPSALPGMKDPRVSAIVERLSEGIALESLLEAVRGAKLDEHIAGKPQFQSAVTILRDAAQVDRFRALLASPPTPKQPSGNPGESDWQTQKAAEKAAEAEYRARVAASEAETLERIRRIDAAKRAKAQAAS